MWVLAWRWGGLSRSHRSDVIRRDDNVVVKFNCRTLRRVGLEVNPRPVNIVGSAVRRPHHEQVGKMQNQLPIDPSHYFAIVIWHSVRPKRIDLQH